MNHPKLTAQQIRDFLPRVPFATLLGIKLTRVHRDGVTIECALRPELTNSFAVAHGGVEPTDALLGAWCVRCGRPFRVGQVVLIEPDEPARHEDCDHAGVGD